MSESIRAVDRALDILLCFSNQRPRLSMTQIAELVGMNKSTVHRLLGTLEKRRFVQREPDTGFYRLGISLLQMTYLTLENSALRQYAAPFLQRLCEQHRETVTLSILDDTNVIFLDVVESPLRVKLAASIGQRLPAFATAAGKAILASLPEETVSQILDHGLIQFTPQTIISRKSFQDSLQQARELGYAISEQEYEDGINAVAAAVLKVDGKPIAAITIAGPAYRLTINRIRTIGPDVVATAREIAQGIELDLFSPQ